MTSSQTGGFLAGHADPGSGRGGGVLLGGGMPGRDDNDSTAESRALPPSRGQAFCVHLRRKKTISRPGDFVIFHTRSQLHQAVHEPPNPTKPFHQCQNKRPFLPAEMIMIQQQKAGRSLPPRPGIFCQPTAQGNCTGGWSVIIPSTDENCASPCMSNLSTS